MNCSICNHAEHDSGKCKNCNCGESNLIHSSDDYFSLEGDYGDFLAYKYTSVSELKNEKGDYKLCQ